MAMIPNPFSQGRTIVRLALMTGLLLAAGCTETMTKMSPSNIWHNLQPHRLTKLNSGQGMSSDVYYSVSDPVGLDPFQASDAKP